MDVFSNQGDLYGFCVLIKKIFLAHTFWASQVVLVVENLPAKAGDVRHTGLIPESGRSPGGGHGNPLQYPCLENPMDRGACETTAYGITMSRR